MVDPVEGDDELEEGDALEVEDEPEGEDAVDGVDDSGIGLSEGIDTLGGRTSGGGLRPPGESSVEPNGMPTRPTG
jgi:hypothetical protein